MSPADARRPPPAVEASGAIRWEVFCQVVDNYGDLGVCRRLAQHLAALGHSVRLWVDDPALMARMAPEIPHGPGANDGGPGLTWLAWSEAVPTGAPGLLEPGDVVVEAFGCNPPPPFVERMAARRPAPPVWINLEYLSAEDYVRRSHGLPSPQHTGPGRGLTKWFFYPGFTEGTGGLLFEDGLAAQRAAFDRQGWLKGWGVDAQVERVISIFAYPTAPLERWLSSLTAAPTPTALMMTEGPLQARAQQWVQQNPQAAAGLRIVALPWLSSEDFDRLLWSADLNFVRGEDSLTRALWAGMPFIWQAYPQQDGVHADKLQAFWNWLWQWSPGPAADRARRGLEPWWLFWNGLAPRPGPAFTWEGYPPSGEPGRQHGTPQEWSQAVQRAARAARARPPLAQALSAFVAQQRGAG